MSDNCRCEKEDSDDDRADEEKFFCAATRMETGGEVIAKRASEPRRGLLEEDARNE